MMFWSGNGGWSTWTVALMWFGMLVFWALVAWGVVSLVRASGADRPTASSEPEQILKVRLARGEITTDEYEKLRNVIKSSS
jgi:putative membrane protein